MKIDKEKYEELLRKFSETVESSEKKFFIAVYIELLSHILQVFRDNKNISISLFLHLFKKKNNREVFVLLPNSEQLLFLHNEVKNELTQVDIVDKVINLVQGYWEKIYISPQLIASEQNKLQSYLLKLQTHDKENQIRKALSSNFWNQTLSGTQYMEEVVNKRRDFFNDSYKIETAIESLTLSKSVSTKEIILEDMILLALESFFTSPDTFFGNKGPFFSLLWGKPVFLHYSRPIGNVAVSVVTKKNSKVDSLLKEENILNDVIPFLHRVGSEIIRTYFLWEISQSHALRSAVAAIMARNMSHNIGSHILARVDINEYNERLASLSADLRIKIFNEIFEEFHKYLQQKSDFLAEVSTEPTRPFIPGYFFRDVILPFEQQIIVKEFIGRNEGITNFEQIKIDLTINNKNISVSSYKCEARGDDHTGCAKGFYKICLQPGCGKKVVPDPEKIENLGEDVLIELPGTLGKFAIYNILEGFIRNSCKHNSEEIRERINKNHSPVLTVHLEVLESLDGEYYICEIWDDISLVNKTGENLVKKMEEKFKIPLIDATGNLNRENWGSAEFKICAALLKDIEFMEMNENYTKCIEVIEKNGYLGYRFYLKKYLKGIFIGKKWKEWLKMG
jgi:hypothetical protein